MVTHGLRGEEPNVITSTFLKKFPVQILCCAMHHAVPVFYQTKFNGIRKAAMTQGLGDKLGRYSSDSRSKYSNGHWNLKGNKSLEFVTEFQPVGF